MDCLRYPDVLYTDNGSDFTSRHLEQVGADLKIRLVFSIPGKPKGRGQTRARQGKSPRPVYSPSPGLASYSNATRWSFSVTPSATIVPLSLLFRYSSDRG